MRAPGDSAWRAFSRPTRRPGSGLHRAIPGCLGGKGRRVGQSVAFEKRQHRLVGDAAVSAEGLEGVELATLDPVDHRGRYDTEECCQLVGGVEPVGHRSVIEVEWQTNRKAPRGNLGGNKKAALAGGLGLARLRASYAPPTGSVPVATTSSRRSTPTGSTVTTTAIATSIRAIAPIVARRTITALGRRSAHPGVLRGIVVGRLHDDRLARQSNASGVVDVDHLDGDLVAFLDQVASPRGRGRGRAR